MKTEEFTKKDGTTGVKHRFEVGDKAEVMYDTVYKAPPRAVNVQGKDKPVIIQDYALKVKHNDEEKTVNLTPGQGKKLEKEITMKGKTIEAYEYETEKFPGKKYIGVKVI